ncbi:MAG TPA: hypothetical protein VKR56_00305 [Candidatus Cybelea sp.]|nr:hypothetical protein [Candidatus Cybelea sp.]
MNAFFVWAERLILAFPWGPEAGWVAISAIVSGCAAIATVLLALYTRKMAQATRKLALETTQLARDTVDASDRADEHHQQTLWPFVSITHVERYPISFGVSVKNIGTGVAVRGTVSVVTGHRKMEPFEILAEYGPIAVQGQTTVNLNVSSLEDGAGAYPEWVVFRVTFESIFHSTGYIDWMFRPSTGELKAGTYQPPSIMTRGDPSTIDSTAPLEA